MLAEGARFFAQEIADVLDFKARMISIRASSYRNTTSSSGEVKISKEIESVRAQKVLLLDDILDTGLTAKFVCKKLQSLGVKEIKTCFLLNKKCKNNGDPKPDFYGFEIPDLFVFGHGLDYCGKFRELKEIRFFK